MTSKPLILPRAKIQRLPQVKAVTIGVGFLCHDGVVICSDRQLTSTSGFKYEDRKIWRSSGNDYTFIFSYAGDPDAAQMIFQKLNDGMLGIVKSKRRTSSSEIAKVGLEKIYRNRHSKGLQTLIGMKLRNSPPFLLRTYGSKLVDGVREYIGVGDSSALQYLADFLLKSAFSVREAEVLGAYIVFVANRYIDQCSGGPDTAILHTDGTVVEGMGGPFPNLKQRFLYCEEEIGQELRNLLFAGGNKPKK